MAIGNAQKLAKAVARSCYVVGGIAAVVCDVETRIRTIKRSVRCSFGAKSPHCGSHLVLQQCGNIFLIHILMKGFGELFVLKVFKVIDLQFLDVVLVLQRFDVVCPVGKVGGKDAHFAVAVNEDVVGGE